MQACDVRNPDRNIFLGKYDEENGEFGTFIAFSCGSNSQNARVSIFFFDLDLFLFDKKSHNILVVLF